VLDIVEVLGTIKSLWLRAWDGHNSRHLSSLIHGHFTGNLKRKNPGFAGVSRALFALVFRGIRTHDSPQVHR
jgi:hypothetical protein